MSDRSDWLAPPDLKAATIAQRAIAAAAETEDRIGALALVAGADVSMKWRDSLGPIHAAIAPVGGAAATATLLPRFAYVPGYLGFREVPALVAAWEMLAVKPDLLIVDGHGRAHPRRCGIATHLGVVLDVPAIGCAKTLLCGEIKGALGPLPGDCAPLMHKGERIGVALRTRARCLPVFVSTGHRVSIDTAVRRVLALSEGRRLPLPIRLAHDAANAARRAYNGEAEETLFPSSRLP